VIRLFIRLSVAVMLTSMGAALASAAEPGKRPSSVSEIALYQGDDRHAYLVEAAKKEGELSLYHSLPIEDMSIVTAAFTKKYGIKVKTWRAGSETILQRIMNEARAGRQEVDVVENNSPENEALRQEKLLQEVRSPYHKDLIPLAVPPHREWVGNTIAVTVAAYNTAKVKKEELPKTYQDLLHPRWQGRLGIEGDNNPWFGTLVQNLGEQQGLKLFSEIVAANGMSLRKGHSLLANLVVSGEVPLALTVYGVKIEQLKQKGAPVDWFVLPPSIGQFKTVAMLKKSPHPNAAVLFYDFMLNEGQMLLANNAQVVTSAKIDSVFRKLPLKFIDPVQALDMNEKWIKTWDEVILKKPR
jgi:iron(III) transport system substrate-binding protein